MILREPIFEKSCKRAEAWLTQPEFANEHLLGPYVVLHRQRAAAQLTGAAVLCS